jgi:O-antigen/teichoic acid export membrane protein
MSRQAADASEHPALRRSYALAVKLMVAVALPLANATAFLATVMVGLLGGREYLPFGATALAIMVWSMPIGWINSVTNYLLIALHEQRSLTKAFALSLAFNVLANLLLLPRYGFVAAAAITIISEIFEGAWFYFYLRRKLGPLPWVDWLWRLVLSGMVMTAVTYLLWPIQPLLALAAGSVLYLGGVVGLRAFDTEERIILADILPAPLRRRLRLGK